MPETGSAAIFSVVLSYGILFSAFTFFLNCFRVIFGDEFIVGVKTAALLGE